MANRTLGDGRRIVTCDGCGTPFAAVIEEDEVRLVGREGEGSDCPNCEESEFSRLEL